MRTYIDDRAVKSRIWLADHGLLVTRNDRRLVALKDKHKGRRCFIIGNGPSLKIADLDMLKNEITFASNKIYLAFDQTEWRPTYYSVTDILVAENNRGIISRLQLTKLFCSSIRSCFDKDKDVIWLKLLRNPVSDGRHVRAFSVNIIGGVYSGATVIYHQLQAAFHMGIREVYLIGVDFKFVIPRPGGGLTQYNEVILTHGGELNHFHPEYRKAGEKWTLPCLDAQREAFLVARSTFERYGGRILNASRETALDIFPRSNFEEIIAEKGACGAR